MDSFGYFQIKRIQSQFNERDKNFSDLLSLVVWSQWNSSTMNEKFTVIHHVQGRPATSVCGCVISICWMQNFSTYFCFSVGNRRKPARFRADLLLLFFPLSLPSPVKSDLTCTPSVDTWSDLSFICVEVFSWWVPGPVLKGRGDNQPCEGFCCHNMRKLSGVNHRTQGNTLMIQTRWLIVRYKGLKW